jgi:hypothetical protein
MQQDTRSARLALPFSPLLVTLLVLAGCGRANTDPATEPPRSSHAAFFAELKALCGLAFEGSLLEGNESDASFAEQRLVMHVRECSEEEVRIPFHVGEDRSRTWLLTRLEDGLRLKHDHRHEDGSEDEITWYGGDTSSEGTDHVQEFLADEHTGRMLPAAATNIWTVEIHPGEAFVYRLRREGTDRRFAVRFDLTRPVEPPPAPWGSTE